MNAYARYGGVAAILAAVGIGGWALRGSGPTPPAPQAEDTARPGAPIVEVALPETLSDTAQMGKRAYQARCASCHGPNAAGQKGVAPPLIHKIYESGHHGDQAFQLAVQNGVRAHHWPFGDMPPIEALSPAQVTDITRYVREIQRANGIF